MLKISHFQVNLLSSVLIALDSIQRLRRAVIVISFKQLLFWNLFKRSSTRILHKWPVRLAIYFLERHMRLEILWIHALETVLRRRYFRWAML